MKAAKISNDVVEVKIVILDEADMMTIEAQSALRRIIEDFSTTTRFCIICNYLSKIIDPISSRCAKFMFNPLPRDIQVDRINFILKSEGLKIDPRIIDFIIDISEGDLRRSINQLQTICSLYSNDSEGLNFNIETLNELCGLIPEETINMLLTAVANPNVGVKSLSDTADEYVLEGYDCLQLVKQLVQVFSNTIDFKKHFKVSDIEKLRNEFFDLLCECEVDCLEGGSPDLEIKQLLVKMNHAVLLMSQSSSKMIID